MQRGEVWWADLPLPAGRRPVVLLSRNRALRVRPSVTVAAITRRERHVPVEVTLDEQDGMPTRCVVNVDDILTIPKRLLLQPITTLSVAKMKLVSQAVVFALDLEGPWLLLAW